MTANHSQHIITQSGVNLKIYDLAPLGIRVMCDSRVGRRREERKRKREREERRERERMREMERKGKKEGKGEKEGKG